MGNFKALCQVHDIQWFPEDMAHFAVGQAVGTALVRANEMTFEGGSACGRGFRQVEMMMQC